MPEKNPMVPPVPNLDMIPLIDTQYKIAKTQCKFDLYELHNWEKWKCLDESDDLIIWECPPSIYISSNLHFLWTLYLVSSQIPPQPKWSKFPK